MKNVVKKLIISTAAVCATYSVAPALSALTLTFDEPGIKHGTRIDNEYSSQGVDIRVKNRGYGPDVAVAYDTTPRKAHWRKNRDTDLNGNWGTGNALIIQENWWCNPVKCLAPDDQGARPAGSIFFDFDSVINDLSFDLIDIESPESIGGSIKYFDAHGGQVGSVNFADFSSATFGNNSFNSITGISLAGLGVSSLEFVFGGSGAIDNISVSTVPLPASLSFLAIGLVALQVFRKRVAKQQKRVA